MTTIKQGQKTEKSKKAPAKPPTPPAKKAPVKAPAPKLTDTRRAGPNQAAMPFRVDFGRLQMPGMASDNTRVAIRPPSFTSNRSRSLPFTRPGGLDIRSLPAPRPTYLSQAPARPPAPSKPSQPLGHHSKSETYQHKAHYGVMAGEAVEWVAHKGGGHLGHKVASKMAPALKVLGPVTGAWQVMNAFGTMMDPYASHDKAATQLFSGLIQMVPAGILSGVVATAIEKMGPSDSQEAKTRRAARARDGVNFDGGYPQSACAYWVEELAKCGARPEEARQLVDQWAERNPEYKQHMGIGRLHRNRPNDQEREAIVKTYLHQLHKGH